MVTCRQGHLSLATFSPSNPHLAALLWKRNFAREEAVTMTTSSTGIAPPPTRHVSTKVGYVTTQRTLLTQINRSLTTQHLVQFSKTVFYIRKHRNLIPRFLMHLNKSYGGISELASNVSLTRHTTIK